MDPNTNTIISSSPDDVVLPQPYGAPSQPRKKPLIIILIIALVILVAGAIVLLVTSQKEGTGDADDSSEDSFLEDDYGFSEYYKCIKKGQESCNKLYEDYYTKISEVTIKDESIIVAIKDFDNIYRLSQIISDNPLPSMDSLLEAYDNNDSAKLNDYLNNYADKYSKYTKVSPELYPLIQKWASNALVVIADYAEVGCISGGNIDYNCAVDHPSQARQEHLNEIYLVEIDVNNSMIETQAIIATKASALYNIFGEKKEE